MHYHEQSYKGNQALLNWLHSIAKSLQIKVGGKTVRELMDEIERKVGGKNA